MNNIAIFGLGAIGSVLTKYLIPNKNNQLYYFNRSQKSSVQILFQEQLKRIPVVINKATNPPFDWIIVCLKTYHLAEAKKTIRTLIGAQTKIVIFRNGLYLADDFSDVVDLQNILPTIIDCPTQKTSEGVYWQVKIPQITLPSLPLSKAFQQLFTDPGIVFHITEKFEKAQWEKLIESSALGALQVLEKKPCIIFKNPKILEVCRQLIREGITVAQAVGVDIPSAFETTLLQKIQGYPDHKGSSMLTDYLAGRQMELEAKIGSIVKVGIENKIYIPVTKNKYQRLLVLASGFGNKLAN